MRADCAHAILVSLHVVLPELPLVNVCQTQLPVLFLIVDTLEKPLPLLILRDVQEYLDDARVVSIEVPFEVHDGAIPILPFRLVVL